MPILTAGTGLYLRALLEGLAEAPARSEELRDRLRASVARRGPEYLHRLLARLDPEAAARIAPRDTQKIIRAIEMRLAGGKSVGEIHRAGAAPWKATSRRRSDCCRRARRSTRASTRAWMAMIEAGWIEEVRELLAARVPARCQAVSVHRLLAAGATTWKGSLHKRRGHRQIQQATRRFAKRQITWFRKEADVHWLSGFGDEPEILAAALPLARGARLEELSGGGRGRGERRF